jgi:ABC-type phosphate transport system substrate-binding protein
MEKGTMSVPRVVVVLVATALLGFGTASPGAADDVAVIVNKANPVSAFTMADLRKILLGPRPRWTSGYEITVLMTPPGQPERSGTLKIVCGMSETDFNLHFVRGLRHSDGSTNDNGYSPKVINSGVQLRQSVASGPNAVGFINASQVDDSVKVVLVDGSSPGQPAYKLRLK